MDFQRVSASERIRVHVPLHFINQEIAVGVKKGGAISHHMVDVEVSCLPDQLPEFLEVDMAALDIGQFLHLSDLIVPAGVEILALHQGADHDLAVASVHAVKSGEASA
jgi:large subunit ribosomal protein L25